MKWRKVKKLLKEVYELAERGVHEYTMSSAYCDDICDLIKKFTDKRKEGAPDNTGLLEGADAKRVNGKLTVVIRDDAPLIHCGDCPSYRTVVIQLSDKQIDALKLLATSRSGSQVDYEEISRVVLE